MVKKKDEGKTKSNEQVQYENGNCFMCELWNAWEGCCDKDDNTECLFINPAKVKKLE